MQKTILITGSTDGIGLETARMLLLMGHHVLVHGRSPQKVERTVEKLSSEISSGHIESYVADLSILANVEMLALAVNKKHSKLDVLINNAGVYKASNPITQDGLDIRFAVNTFAPYILTKQLLSIIPSSGRVVNVSSAAQSPINLDALRGILKLSDGAAYAQSKLALIMWSRHLVLSLGNTIPAIISVNPGSMLGSKMVKDAFGVVGGDISIGADILRRVALDEEFATATGKYFDNDSRQFRNPQFEALDSHRLKSLVQAMDTVLEEILKKEQSDQ